MKTKILMLNYTEEQAWQELSKLINPSGKGRSKTISDVEEAMNEMNRSEQETFWSNISKYSKSFFEQDENEQEQYEIMREVAVDIMESLLVLGNLQVNILVSDKKQISSPSKAFSSFVVIIGMFFKELNGPAHTLALNLCRSWIMNKFEFSKEILPSSLLESIKICLLPNAKKQDVKNSWILRDGLSNLIAQNTNENVELDKELCSILISYSLSPLVLGCEDGIKLISAILSISPLVAELHEAIKKTLPHTTKSLSEKYAQIYFRAWKNSQGEIKKVLEQNCLQDFMYLAVHADPFASHLSRNINNFLHHIHKHKKHPQTASVIYSLYEPFIWRSLKVANGYVRMNAVTLLCDLFPCTDVSASQEEREELLTQQYQALLALLVDPCHLVRIATLKGVFSILSNFWLMIPASTIKKMFQIFLGKLIVDASSSNIRKCVVEGIASLLDNPDAGAFMVDILPHVSGAFDDVNSNVRVAFVKLLLKVKATKFVKYWKLVPLEHILNRLAEDLEPVRTLIVELIHSSFLPAHLDDKEMLNRCISLIETNRSSARRFYQIASKKMDLNASTRFILLIWRTLLRYIHITHSNNQSQNISFSSDVDKSCFKLKDTLKSVTFCDSLFTGSRASSEDIENLSQSQRRNRRKAVARKQQNKENESENATSVEMPLNNPVVVGGLLDTVVILWTLNAPQLGLPQNIKYLEALRSRVSRTFPTVWSFFKESEEISKTLLYLASFLPKSHVSTMVGLCLSRITKMVEDKETSDEFTTYINALCNWNRLDDIMEVISDWIAGAFSSVSSLNSLKTKKHKKYIRVCFEEEGKPKPLLGLRFLSHILVHPINKLSLLQTNKLLLLQLCKKMSDVKSFLERRFRSDEPLSAVCSDKFLLTCWSDYLCVVSLLTQPPEMQNNNNEDRSPGARSSGHHQDAEEFDGLSLHRECIRWMNSFLEDTASSIKDEVFFYGCVSRLIKAGSDFIAVGFASDEYLHLYLKFSQLSLQKAAFDVSLWRWSLFGISHAHTHFTAYAEGVAHLQPSTSITADALLAALDAFSSRDEVDCLDTENLLALSEALSLIMVSLSQKSELMLHTISNHLVKICLESLKEQLCTNPDGMSDAGRVKDLQGRSLVLVSSVHANTKLSNAFVRELGQGFGRQINEIELMWAGAWLLSLFFNDGGKISRQSLKDAVRSSQHFLAELQPPQPPNSDDSSDHKRNFNTYQKVTEILEKLATL